VENRDFAEKNRQWPRTTSSRFRHFIKGNFESLESVLPMFGRKNAFISDNDHELIGIVGVCPGVFSVTGLSFSFFE
jgi:hypothetical protein